MIHNVYMNIELAGETLIIASAAKPHSMVTRLNLPGSIVESMGEGCSNAVWGDGQRLVVQHGQRTTALTLYDDNPFVHIETYLNNPGAKDREIKRLDIATMNFEMGVNARKLNTLGCGGLRPCDNPAGSYAYSVLADPESRKGVLCGWLTQRRGVGLMLPYFEEGAHNLDIQLASAGCY